MARRLFFVVSIFILFSCTGEVLDELGTEDELDVDAGEVLDELGTEDELDVDAGEVLDELGTEDELADHVDAGEVLDELVELDVEKWDRGGYPSPGPWVTVAYESRDDYGGFMTASRIALLGRLAVEVWRELDYPNGDAVADHVSRFHVYAISSSDTWARFRYPDLYAESPEKALDAVGESGAWCKPAGDPRYVDVPDGARFFIAIDASFLAHDWSAETVLHEITHAILFAAYGDADGDHAKGDMWLPRSGVDNGSFMALVLDKSPF